jgi:hypothetical protein
LKLNAISSFLAVAGFSRSVEAGTRKAEKERKIEREIVRTKSGWLSCWFAIDAFLSQLYVLCTVVGGSSKLDPYPVTAVDFVLIFSEGAYLS